MKKILTSMIMLTISTVAIAVPTSVILENNTNHELNLNLDLTVLGSGQRLAVIDTEIILSANERMEIASDDDDRGYCAYLDGEMTIGNQNIIITEEMIHPITVEDIQNPAMITTQVIIRITSNNGAYALNYTYLTGAQGAIVRPQSLLNRRNLDNLPLAGRRNINNIVNIDADEVVPFNNLENLSNSRQALGIVNSLIGKFSG